MLSPHISLDVHQANESCASIEASDNTSQSTASDVQFLNKGNPSTSNHTYKGVFARNCKFTAIVCDASNKRICLGTFFLRSDAALAYDKGVDVFKVSGRFIGPRKNFRTKEEYQHDRQKELEATEMNVEKAGTVADVENQIQKRINEIIHRKPHERNGAFSKNNELDTPAAEEEMGVDRPASGRTVTQEAALFDDDANKGEVDYYLTSEATYNQATANENGGMLFTSLLLTHY